jgi:hypothetical protein
MYGGDRALLDDVEQVMQQLVLAGRRDDMQRRRTARVFGVPTRRCLFGWFVRFESRELCRA